MARRRSISGGASGPDDERQRRHAANVASKLRLAMMTRQAIYLIEEFAQPSR